MSEGTVGTPHPAEEKPDRCFAFGLEIMDGGVSLIFRNRRTWEQVFRVSDLTKDEAMELRSMLELAAPYLGD